MTPLQLAQAYAVLGSGGMRRPVSMRRVDAPPSPASACSTKRSPASCVRMMESVVSDEGTARRAAVVGYRVAGKTGTAWKAAGGGYSPNRYMAVFGGVVPASNPRLAAVVVIDEPRARPVLRRRRRRTGVLGGDVGRAAAARHSRPTTCSASRATTLVQAQDPW